MGENWKAPLLDNNHSKCSQTSGYKYRLDTLCWNIATSNPSRHRGDFRSWKVKTVFRQQVLIETSGELKTPQMCLGRSYFDIIKCNVLYSYLPNVSCRFKSRRQTSDPVLWSLWLCMCTYCAYVHMFTARGLKWDTQYDVSAYSCTLLLDLWVWTEVSFERGHIYAYEKRRSLPWSFLTKPIFKSIYLLS